MSKEAEDEYVRAAYDRHARGKCWADGCAFCACQADLIAKLTNEETRIYAKAAIDNEYRGCQFDHEKHFDTWKAAEECINAAIKKAGEKA